MHDANMRESDLDAADDFVYVADEIEDLCDVKDNVKGSTNKSGALDLKICGAVLDGNLQDLLLKNGCHSLTLLDMASLEVSHSKEQLAKIKKVDRLFKTGWLHDEVINSFFLSLERQFDNILYCGLN